MAAALFERNTREIREHRHRGGGCACLEEPMTVSVKAGMPYIQELLHALEVFISGWRTSVVTPDPNPDDPKSLEKVWKLSGLR